VRCLRRGLAWTFGVGAPIVCFGVAAFGGWFGDYRVLVFGYALCCVAAFTAKLVLRRPRTMLDPMLAGALAGAFLFALPFGILFGYFGVLLVIPALFSGDSEMLGFASLGLSSLAGTLAYGWAAWKAQKVTLRPAAWSLGLAAPPLLLLLGQSIVWHQTSLETPRLVAAVDSGVPVEQIELGYARILGPLSDWPELQAELEGDSGAANERDERLAELYERLTGRSVSRFID
jgi:hypothetical protein